MNPALFSSAKDEWSTPQALFDALDAEFGFVLDAAASPANAKCPFFFTRDDDGLEQSWQDATFCNPPYGRAIGKWVRKAFQESRIGNVVVMLIPARTDAAYWHDYVMRAAEVRLIRGRLRFSGATVNAPFPSCVVVFWPVQHRAVFSSMDRILDPVFVNEGMK